jgi:hypothetical protein
VGAGFTRLGAGPIWTLDGGATAVTAAFAPADPGGAPSSLPLADTLSPNPGTYLFLPPGASLGDPFPAALQSFLAAQPLPPTFVWIPAPADPPATWRATTLAVASGATVGAAGVLLRSLALWIGAGCALSLDQDQDALALTPPDASRIYLTGASGAAMWTTAGTPVTIPFTATQAGCLTTAITIDTSPAGGDLDHLDVGLRMFTPVAGTALLPDRLDSWRYPVFQPGGSVPLQVCLDPLNPTLPSRTSFGLVPPNAPNGPELGSYYVTTNGLAVTLTPCADPPGALVPAVRTLAAPPAASDPLYLVPSGAFTLRVRNAQGNEVDGAPKLACGISGVEYVTLDQPGSEIRFSPGSDALAAGRGLGGPSTTAYASLFGPSGASLTYRAQPDSATVFTPSGTDGFLCFYELAGQTLPAASAVTQAAFPMLPFTGLPGKDVQAYADVELKAVAPARRAIVGAAAGKQPSAPAAAIGNGAVAAATPQGLVGEFTAGVMSALDLMRSNGSTVQIQGVSDDLVSALQSNQLFLVVSDPATLQTATTPPPVDWTVEIPATADRGEWWQFDAGTTWSEHHTLLVIKHAGKSLATLAADLTTWTEPDAFNPKASGGAGAAQRTLLEAIDVARAQVGVHPQFQPFVQLADDDAWQGILILNCAMPLVSLPAQLAGLSAGIDQKLFAAHHLGLTITPVTAGGQDLTQTDSSLFGLVFYESPTSAAGAPGPYAFVVQSLLVRFANSAVADFASTIDLLVDELFGDPVELTQSKANVIELLGVYQQQGGNSTYTFTTTKDSLFAATSGVLKSVDVASAQFVTVTPPGGNAQAESTFLLSGSLTFAPPAEHPETAFDLFSYAPLAYSNLRIELRYTPGNPASDEYVFDASKLALDPAQSTPRGESLFASFPLTPSGFVHVPKPPKPKEGKAPAAATPSSLGFLGVQAATAQGALGAPWFGLVADLGLGTAGALASEAGFKASMLAAWAPGSPSSPNVAIGLKLPGTGGSGGKLLSLESVLKLKIGGLQFVRADGTYVLELERIALSVLMLTFPPGGQVDALLFADPTGKDHTTLGWYAAYAKGGG